MYVKCHMGVLTLQDTREYFNNNVTVTAWTYVVSTIWILLLECPIYMFPAVMYNNSQQQAGR